MGPIQYASFSKTWGVAPRAAVADQINITATNLATASIDVARADVNCHVALKINTDGPLTVMLPGCGRVVHAG